MKNVVIFWAQEHEFILSERSCDELGPKELMLLAMGKCAGLTALSLFEKMKVVITSFEIHTSGELTEPEAMAFSTYKYFRQSFRIGSPKAEDHAKILHALELVNGKYCGVGLMYSHIAPISYEILINNRIEESLTIP